MKMPTEGSEPAEQCLPEGNEVLDQRQHLGKHFKRFLMP